MNRRIQIISRALGALAKQEVHKEFSTENLQRTEIERTVVKMIV